MRATEAGPLGAVVRLFLRLGFTAFGGPAAHIAMMHDEVVTRRKWMDEQYFLDLIGATNLVPGPNSTEMAIHVGYDRAGWRGLLAAGICFILPASLIVGILAWAYVHYGSTPKGTALLYGIKPVVIAIILQALLKLGRRAVTGGLLAGVGLTTVVLYLLGINVLLLLLGGGLSVLAMRAAGQRQTLLPVLLPTLSSLKGLAKQIETTTTTARLDQLFLVFLKVGAVLYGSGYVLLAFLRNDLVVRLGWLTDQQLLDAVAIGQFTPGPVFTTATFVGYVVGGVPGAVLATAGIFLPSFCFVALLNRIVPYLRDAWWSAALLDGVNVTAVGLMVGVTWQLGSAALVDVPTALLAVAATVLLFRFKLKSAWLVLGGAMVGLALNSL
jgi:chromate transporter